MSRKLQEWSGDSHPDTGMRDAGVLCGVLTAAPNARPRQQTSNRELQAVSSSPSYEEGLVVDVCYGI